MKRLSLCVTVIALGATGGLAAGCGGGASEPPAAITADDLPMMVLQPEDVPAGLLAAEEDNQQSGFVKPEYDPRAKTMFLRRFERPPGESEDRAVCVLSSVLLYASAKDAKDTWDEVQELQAAFEQAAGSVVATEELALPDLGEARIGFRALEPAEAPCETYGEQSGQSHHVFFRTQNVAAGVIVYWAEPNRPPEIAIELAKKQANRIEAVFAENPSD